MHKRSLACAILPRIGNEAANTKCHPVCDYATVVRCGDLLLVVLWLDGVMLGLWGGLCGSEITKIMMLMFVVRQALRVSMI